MDIGRRIEIQIIFYIKNIYKVEFTHIKILKPIHLSQR